MRLFKNISENTGCGTGFMPGCAGMYFARPNTPVAIVMVPLAPFISNGVDTHTLEKFLDNEKGQKAFHEHGIIIQMRPWDLVFVPCGYHDFVCNVQLNEDKVKHFKPNVSSVCHVPLKIKLEEADTNVALHYRGLNRDYMAAKKASMWKQRASFFETLLTTGENEVSLSDR
jgi:hypothetical protein